MLSKTQSRHPIPLRYPGGKFYAIKILRRFWQSVDYDDYREPFAGGASVFFTKSKVENNWLNDIDSELITTYKIMQSSELREKLIEMLSVETASKKRWREIFEFEPSNELETAYRYYYLNRTSFSGKMVSPGWGYRPKRSLPPERWHERITPCGKKLENVKITDKDFEDVINAKSNGAKTLIFADPPYFNPPKKKHYRNGFEYQDHIRLCENLRNTSHNFFLTYDDVPEIRKLYRWANIHEVEFFYRVENSNIQKGNRRLGFELVITNYEIPKQLNFNFQ